MDDLAQRRRVTEARLDRQMLLDADEMLQGSVTKRLQLSHFILMSSVSQLAIAAHQRVAR